MCTYYGQTPSLHTVISLLGLIALLPFHRNGYRGLENLENLMKCMDFLQRSTHKLHTHHFIYNKRGSTDSLGLSYNPPRAEISDKELLIRDAFYRVRQCFLHLVFYLYFNSFSLSILKTLCRCYKCIYYLDLLHVILYATEAAFMKIPRENSAE